jgi:hypothetical protein
MKKVKIKDGVSKIETCSSWSVNPNGSVFDVLVENFKTKGGEVLATIRDYEGWSYAVRQKFLNDNFDEVIEPTDSMSVKVTDFDGFVAYTKEQEMWMQELEDNGALFRL